MSNAMRETDIHEKFPHLIDVHKMHSIEEKMPHGDTISALSESFKTLGDPTRLRIVIALRQTELCVHEIASAVKMSVSAVSHQLRILRSMKIVKLRRQGKMSFYSLDDEHIIQLLELGLSHVSE
jgi:DNA-binding transcriptional ArsR family regulator